MAEHSIETGTENPVRQVPYRIPYAQREEMMKEVQRMEEMGVVQPSKSDWASPVVMVPKKDGTQRFCVDFRKVNSISKFDAYPMARIDDIIDRLGRARYLSTIDLTRGYWQVPLSEESRKKTAFTTPTGLYEFTTMPFGLHGAPATFQRMMDRIIVNREEGLEAGGVSDNMLKFWSRDNTSALESRLEIRAGQKIKLCLAKRLVFLPRSRKS